VTHLGGIAFEDKRIADIVDQHAPLLAKHLERIRNHPQIAAYYAARRK
jgi:hypothetical protein